MAAGGAERYATADIDVAGPIPALALSGEECGVGILLRQSGRPLDYLMRAMEPGTVLSPDQVEALVRPRVRAALLRECIRSELSPEPVPPRGCRLTVAVCTHDRTELLTACLRRLCEVRDAEPGFADVELLVVDNAPSDSGTRELVEVLDGVRYVVEPRPGLDFARNHALAEATGTWLAYVDDDVEVDRAWLAGLAAAVQEHPDAAAITGLVLPFELATRAQVLFERRGGFRRGFVPLRYAGDRLPGNPLYPCGAGIFGAGCNMAYRRDVLTKLGGFDEALDTGRPLPGGGDLDMFYRVVRSGRVLVYEPRMLVFHKHRREYAALRRQYWTWGTGFMAFVAKTYGSDRPQRRRLRRLVRWWLVEQLRTLRAILRGRETLPVELALAELCGGVVGLAGTYGRSRRRSAAIVAAHR